MLIQPTLTGPLLVLAGALCFSTTGFAQALVVGDGATPLVIGALRMLIGGAALAAWCVWRGILPKKDRWPLKGVILPALGLAGYQVLFFTGTASVGVAVGTVASIGVSPLGVAALNWLIYREKPVRAWYPATAAAVLGLVLLNWTDGALDRLCSLLPSLAAGLSYAVYVVCSKPLRMYAPEAIMMMACLLCGLLLGPFLFISPLHWLLSVKGVLVALNLGVVTAALAFSLMLAGLMKTPAPTAATLGLAEPLCAALLGFACLHEPVTAQAVTGIACILCSALVLIFWPTPPCGSGRSSPISERRA
ncbi:EamA family transporter [Desulfovibrio aminophilus]|uniref:DMT family transporter n=1 Tax=Desulfovibrio aminophilus TaxID=81425 RepID=UPI003394FC76